MASQMNTRPIPPIGALINKMPSGREIHTIKPYHPPVLDREALEAIRAPPDQTEDVDGEASSDDETLAEGAASAAGGAHRSSYY